MFNHNMDMVEDALSQEMEAYAVGLARVAGQILLDHFGKPLDVEYKGDDRGHPVSAVDKEVEEHLRKVIKGHYVHHAVLGEESLNDKPQEAEFLWVIDPLDGTVNFINSLPIFAVSIGLLHRLRPIVGAIFAPSPHHPQGRVFHARWGGGSFMDGQQISVAQNPQPNPSALSILSGRSWRRWRFPRKRQPLGQFRVLGSIAYELALVAQGVLQYAVFASPRIWDIAGGALLVKEAGGTVLIKGGPGQPWHPLDLFEAPRTKKRDEPRGIHQWSAPTVAANPELAWWLIKNLEKGSTFPMASIWRRFLGSG